MHFAPPHILILVLKITPCLQGKWELVNALKEKKFHFWIFSLEKLLIIQNYLLLQ